MEEENEVSKPFANSFLKELAITWGCLVTKVLTPYAKGPKFNPRTHRGRQEDKKFKININYTVSYRSATLYIIQSDRDKRRGRKKEGKKSLVYNILSSFCTNPTKHIGLNWSW